MRHKYALDFSTYFGSYNGEEIRNKSEIDEKKLNDVILPKLEGFGLRHFMIKYWLDKNGYFLKDLGEGSGTFIKIE